MEYSLKYKLMFGYTVFLKIGNLGATALTDLYRESYELIGCEYGFPRELI